MMPSNPFTSSFAPQQQNPASLATALLAPNAAIEQLKLARMQQIAQLLQQQSMEPDGGTQVIGGWAIPNSPWQGINKIAQGIGASYLTNQNIEKQAEIQQQLAQSLAKFLPGAQNQIPNPPNVASNEVPAQSSIGTQPQNTNQTVPQSVTQSMPDQSQNPFGMNNLMTGMAIGAFGGQPAQAAFYDSLKPTELQKNNNAYLTQDQAKQNYIASQRNAATLTLDPNKTAILPNGQMIVAPDFANGAYGGFDANGNPVKNAIPGSNQIAQNTAAATTAGTEGAKIVQYTGADGKPHWATQSQLTGLDNSRPSGSVGSNLPVPFLNAEASASQANGLPPNILPTFRKIESNNTFGALNKNNNGTTDSGIYQINSSNKGMNGDNPDDAAKLAAAAYQKANGDPRLTAIYYHGGLNTNPNSAENQRYANTFMANYGSQPTPPGTQSNGIVPPQSEAEKAQAAADIQVKNADRIAEAQASGKNMGDYKVALDDKLAKSQDLQQRLQYTRDALQKFQTGGGKEMRAELAQKLQALGFSKNIVDGVAGGDLGSAQVINKLAVQEAIQNMKTALANDSGGSQQGNRVAMQAFLDSNTDLDTDPRAFEKLLNLQSEIHNRILAQSNAFQQYKEGHNGDSSGFPNYWANQSVKNGSIQAPVTNSNPYRNTVGNMSSYTPMTAERWAAMKSGDTFIDAQGNTRRKP